MSKSSVSALSERSHGGRSGVSFGEFFVYRGWLSPGVRLFQGISFKTEAPGLPELQNKVASAFEPFHVKELSLLRGPNQQENSARLPVHRA